MRNTFGGQVSDAVIQPPSANGNVYKASPNQSGGTAWSAKVGGSQYTDLLAIGTDPAPICTDADGFYREFQGPDNIQGLYVDFGGVRRYLKGREVGTQAAVAAQINDPGAALFLNNGDVRRWGAVGDGTTNDTAAVQAASNASSTIGTGTYFPPQLVFGVRPPSGLDYMLELKATSRWYGGGTIKVLSSAGDYRAVATGASPSTDLSGLLIEGVTIDQNNTGNPVTNVSTGGPLFNGYPRYAIYAPVGVGMTVRRCTLKDFDSVNTVVLGGTDAVTDGNKFIVGNSVGVHDHSSIYCTADGQTHIGNRFYGVAGGGGSTTALETHGAGQIVAYNRVRDYYTGYNITGIATAGSDGAIVSHNLARDVNIGFDLWSGSGTGLRHASLDHNKVIINHDNWIRTTTDYPRGFMIDPGVTVDIDTLNLDHNEVWFKPSVATPQAGELQGAGYSFWISSTTPVIRNLTIDHCTTNGSFSTGFRLQATIMRAKLDNLEIYDPGSSAEVAMSSFYKSAVTIAGTVQDLTIGSIRVFDTRGTHVISAGVQTSLTAATRCVQGDITAVCYDGAVVPTFVQTAGKLFTVKADAPVATRFTTSLYYSSLGTRSTVTTVNGTGTAAPFFVSQANGFDRIAAETTAAGTAGTVIRLGIYADNGNGTPGALVIDAGTIAGDVVAANEITITQNLAPGLYWLAAVSQGGTPTVRAVLGSDEAGVGASTLAGAVGANPRTGFQFSAAGALPATFASIGQTVAAIRVWLRSA